ncbi:protein rep [Solibacillus sp. FSL W7-1436]|uniref:protein rep n=1 Tax=Solibacillus sp. FSL W7-1436 TaxID=2921705 RepID=UPI0030F7CB45
MTKKQEVKITKNELKSTELGKYILERYTPKRDLVRKLAEYAKGVFTPKTLERVKTCGDFMQHLTTFDMSAKRVHRSSSCGNRFCPICTWNKAKKDAIAISVTMQAIREEQEQEYIFLTLTAPNVTGEALKNEIDKFNTAFNKLFKRRNVRKVINGYVRKLEVTYNKERFITKDMYEKAKSYFDSRNLKIDDNNPNYDTYHPHFHVLMAVNKSYFTSRDYINQSAWLEMWRECMDDMSITQVDIRKVRSSEKSENGAVLEVAKYSAKGNELYHSQSVFEIFYKSLKGRQLLTFNGFFKDYVKKFKNGELDKYKKKDENEYTHLLTSVWKTSKYENMLRELTVEEFEEYNTKAKFIEQADEVE